MGKQVVIVGGGLAGMVVARELRKAGLAVRILEASERLGGKAGAEKLGPDRYVDHGYHVFPGWYANTRRILAELDLDGNLIDLHRFFYFRKPGDGAPRKVGFHDLQVPSNALRNLFRGIGPWPEMALMFYALFQLANEPFRDRSALDRTSLNGFLRSRPFVTDAIAELQHHTVLQGSSIPAYEVSAMTMQRVARAWLRYPTPLYSILNGDLQTRFILPFEDALRAAGVAVELDRPVRKLDIVEHRVTSVRSRENEPVGTADDLYVLSTPPEVTTRFVDETFFAAENGPTPYPPSEKAIADTYNLRTAPMAALHLALRRKIDLPPEHVVLYKSRFLTSFIDLAGPWGLDTSELSLIASDFVSLQSLTDDDPAAPDVGPIDLPAAKSIVDELLEYVPEVRREDIDASRSVSIFNVRRPLFLNTVGAWPFRPRTKTRLHNLFVAGDYCQTEADITTMESAVLSGLQTARAILEHEKIPHDVRIDPLKTHAGWNPYRSYPRIPARAIEYAVAPFVAILFGAWMLWSKLARNGSA